MRDAKQWTRDGMQACIPPGCPLPFTVVSARFTKERVAVAKVEMFDGLPGTLEVSQQGSYLGWCLEWKELSGGATNWNGTNWERIDPAPKQLKLELAMEA